jgi:hypothetical protein
MLDRLLNVVAHKLGSYTAAVNAQRRTIEAERASDSARDHAGREFVNPEGFTTPLPKAAQNAQNAYARARRDFEKADPMGALAATVAMMVARERRDEAVAALKAHQAAEDLRKDEGVHQDIRPFFADMFELGIEPRRLANVRVETLVIICDMIMWDGHDPDMEDEASPMPDIFGIYASRQILKSGQFGAGTRSKPGVPLAPVRHTDPEYFMFNYLVSANDDQASAAQQPEALAPAEPAETLGQVDRPVSAPVAIEPPVVSAALAERETQELTPDDARRLADAIFNADPHRMGIYWPRDIDVGEYDPAKLIPALERMAASERNWSGVADFLGAARQGQAREFIKGRQASGVQRLAADLLAGDERAVTTARRLGLMP